MPTVNYQCD